ncbi:predicted protein [Aspergillus nidulans FGSC A4]|uniref:Uncharacterized protein n=1 Tax=Emericella nidulans (strain FGSC A4 / ATCC 38163 / CBS 112.46 / NRRL 194 / M139) TaxID=227321 RepID=Q5B308_EMENI|nr:hypothetical protein [Aspergillus nidulans FGSC A4]EAA60167.1 predicted protein [Aspergillus nidulans FGSC A4]CBF76149.1 TPA: conserved hypothetical protein [Aspergillus nidulans FGSC A4]|eukprot:XP_662676.1 predicted protein [Aspergillus nidulans FGSC A4]
MGLRHSVLFPLRGSCPGESPSPSPTGWPRRPRHRGLDLLNPTRQEIGWIMLSENPLGFGILKGYVTIEEMRENLGSNLSHQYTTIGEGYEEIPTVQGAAKPSHDSCNTEYEPSFAIVGIDSDIQLGLERSAEDLYPASSSRPSKFSNEPGKGELLMELISVTGSDACFRAALMKSWVTT